MRSCKSSFRSWNLDCKVSLFVRFNFSKLKWNNFFYFLPRVTTPGEKGDRVTGCQNVSVAQKLFQNHQMFYLFVAKNPKNNTFPRCHRS